MKNTSKVYFIQHALGQKYFVLWICGCKCFGFAYVCSNIIRFHWNRTQVTLKTQLEGNFAWYFLLCVLTNPSQDQVWRCEFSTMASCQCSVSDLRTLYTWAFHLGMFKASVPLPTMLKVAIWPWPNFWLPATQALGSSSSSSSNWLLPTRWEIPGLWAFGEQDGLGCVNKTSFNSRPALYITN